MKTVKYVACYCRTSTNLQSTGLEAQERALIDYCKSKAIKNFKTFKDEGQSGAKSSRPALDQLLVEVRAGRITTVVTYSLSRLSRSTTHLLATLEELKQLGVGFVSLSESLDLYSPSGRMTITVLAAVAELERELVCERVKTGLVNARAKGKTLGRPKTRNAELIHELHRQGMSHRKIAKLAKCSTWSVSEELKGRLENHGPRVSNQNRPIG